jgi:uncharacterized membrane protein YphA (DoxX/SURF4 family)
VPRGRALTRLLTARTPALPVALARIGLGIAMFGRSVKTARDLYLVQHDPIVIAAPPFTWSPNLDTVPEVVVVGGLGLLASLTLLVGYRARLSSLVLAGSLAFLYLVDQNFWANHMYFLALMLMLLSLIESDRALSIRAGWGSDAVVALWPVLLMKIQLSLVYFFTAVAKINPHYLSGDVLGDRSILPAVLQPPIVLSGLAVVSIAAELFLAFALWIPRLRLWAFVLGLGLHGFVPVILGPYAGLIVYSVATLAIYALFLDTPDVARIRTWWRRPSGVFV